MKRWPAQGSRQESQEVVEQKDAQVHPGEESSSFELSRNAQIQGGEREDPAVSLA